MENNEKKMKHLEMIEGVIDRMGSNSFQLKGWAVTLVALVGALSAQGSDKRFILIAFIPLIAFWFLDAYYLQMERKYEILYKCVSEKSESEIELEGIFFKDKKSISFFFSLLLLIESVSVCLSFGVREKEEVNLITR